MADIIIPTKHCNLCLQPKPLDAFYPVYGRNNDVYRRGICKICTVNENQRRSNTEATRQRRMYLRSNPPTSKECKQCRETLPIEHFHLQKGTVDEFNYFCKKCAKMIRDSYRDLPKNREKERERGKRIRTRGHYATYQRRCLLKTKYGMTQAQWDKMLESQNGQCAICHRDVADCPNGRLCVDHCHTTNIIRGLLCSGCNSALGLFQDNIDALQRAIRYLQRFQESP